MEGRERKMKRTCQICGDVAKSMHFGGLSCDSCKAFFRRSVQSDSFEHFRCGGDQRCSITIASRKFCKYCRFRKCERVGMVRAWVMSEDERVQLMKSRLLKHTAEDDEEAAAQRDQELYGSYRGRVALTAGGAPNLHGLNRRRHMECRLRDEVELDGSQGDTDDISTRLEPGEVDVSVYRKANVGGGGKEKFSRKRKYTNESDNATDSSCESVIEDSRSRGASSAEETRDVSHTPASFAGSFACSSPSSGSLSSVHEDVVPEGRVTSSAGHLTKERPPKATSEPLAARVLTIQDRILRRHSSSPSYSHNAVVDPPEGAVLSHSGDSSSNSRDSLKENRDDVFSDSNNNNNNDDSSKEVVPLRIFPRDPEKYNVMINERPGFPITNYMSRQQMVKLSAVMSNMKQMEHRLPYSNMQGTHGVMAQYSHFIKRVTFFLNQFEEFTCWPLELQENAIKKNITVIALVFGSSFLQQGGVYKNVLQKPSVSVTDMGNIQGTLTPGVFDTFREVLGILGQFHVDVRMGYMIIFIVIFDSERYHETHEFYRRLLYKYICWKYGEGNAEYINANLFRAIEGIRKHAHVFENMTAGMDDTSGNFNKESSSVQITELSNDYDCDEIKTEALDEVKDDGQSVGSDCSNGGAAVNLSPGGDPSGFNARYGHLRNMFYSGASLEQMRDYFHKGGTGRDSQSAKDTPVKDTAEDGSVMSASLVVSSHLEFSSRTSPAVENWNPEESNNMTKWTDSSTINSESLQESTDAFKMHNTGNLKQPSGFSVFSDVTSDETVQEGGEGNPMSQNIQEMMSRHGLEQTEEAMRRVQGMIAAHGGDRLSELYQRGDLSNLRSMFNSGHTPVKETELSVPEQPTQPWSNALAQGNAQLQALYQNHRGGGGGGSVDPPAVREAYVGRLGKIRQMMQQEAAFRSGAHAGHYNPPAAAPRPALDHHGPITGAMDCTPAQALPGSGGRSIQTEVTTTGGDGNLYAGSDYSMLTSPFLTSLGSDPSQYNFNSASPHAADHVVAAAPTDPKAVDCASLGTFVPAQSFPALHVQPDLRQFNVNDSYSDKYVEPH